MHSNKAHDVAFECLSIAIFVNPNLPSSSLSVGALQGRPHLNVSQVKVVAVVETLFKELKEQEPLR